MIVRQVIAALDRHRDRVRTQVQLARDIGQLRAVARMLFEDKPDKTKAVEAVHDIAAKRLAQMDAEARALFESPSAQHGDGEDRDAGDRLRWLMQINRPGLFPYTQGIDRLPAADDASHRDSHGDSHRSTVLPAADAAGLAAALAAGWARLAASRHEGASVEQQAMQIAVAFDEHRDAAHRALAAAARRLWAVSLREHFGVSAEGLKLVLVQTVDASSMAAADGHIDECAIARAEQALLAALHDSAAAASQP